MQLSAEECAELITALTNTVLVAHGLPTMLSDDGVRWLAIAVLQQAVADSQSAIPEYRRSAAAFMAWREDFDQFWCALIGLDGDAVRERLREQISQYREAA